MCVTPIAFLSGFGFKSSIAEIIFKQFKYNSIQTFDLLHFQPNMDIVIRELRGQIHQPMIWVGWSLGGLIALAFCYRYPFLCRKLVMICSTPKFMADGKWPGISQCVMQVFQNNLVLNPTNALRNFAFELLQPHATVKNYRHLCHYIDFSISSTLTHQLAHLRQCDLRKAFQDLEVPVQLLLSEKDVLLPAKLAVHLNQLNDQAKIKILTEAGHAPFITHQYDFSAFLATCLADD